MSTFQENATIQENVTRKSNRIIDIKKEKYCLLYKELGYIIHLIKGESELKKRIDLYCKFYTCVLEKFHLLAYNNAVNTFLNIMLHKGEESLNILKSYSDDGLKIKTQYKRLLKIYSSFEKKYIDYSFQSLINTFPNILKGLEKKHTNSIDECPICFETIKKKDCIVTNCNHYFHKLCLAKNLLERHTCPICRATI